jgi:hypothetical protein
MGAFLLCSGLSSVTIPAGAVHIGSGAFVGCAALAAIRVSSENRQYQDRDGVLYTKDGADLHSYPAGGKTVYAIPPGVTTIGSYAFAYCADLVSVTIPPSVTTIGDGAFAYCADLVSATIPETVTAIGEQAFSGCDSLTPEFRAEIEKRFGEHIF